jgi:hypothetical protein
MTKMAKYNLPISLPKVETNYTVTIGDCMMLLKIPAKIVNIVARH